MTSFMFIINQSLKKLKLLSLIILIFNGKGTRKDEIKVIFNILINIFERI